MRVPSSPVSTHHKVERARRAILSANTLFHTSSFLLQIHLFEANEPFLFSGFEILNTGPLWIARPMSSSATPGSATVITSAVHNSNEDSDNFPVGTHAREGV